MRRQSSKMPKAERLPSGAYRCRVLVDGKRLSFTADTALEAQRAAMYAKMDREYAQVKKCPKTLGKAIEEYCNSRESILSPSTIRGYMIVRNHRLKKLMEVPLEQIQEKDWQRALNEDAKTQNAKTVKNTWCVVQRVLKIEGLPVPQVNLPQQIKNMHPFLDESQVFVFLDAIKGTDVELAALLALHGLRRSELFALTWKDIDLKNRTISVNGAMVLDKDNKIVRKETTKNESSRRTIRMVIPRIYDVLSEAEKTDPVVKCAPQTVYNRVTRVCKECGLPNVGVHGLRHTFASICYFLEFQEKDIMDMGGWSDPTVLRQIYTHISQGKKRKSEAKLEGFFAGQSVIGHD